MFDISHTLEEDLADLIVEYLGYKIEPWEAEEIATKIMDMINERVSLVLE